MKIYQFFLFTLLMTFSFTIEVSAQQIFGKWFISKNEILIIETNNTWSYYENNNLVDTGIYQINRNIITRKSYYSGINTVYSFQIGSNQLILNDQMSGAQFICYRVLPKPKQKSNDNDSCNGMSFEDCMFYKHGVIVNTPNIWHGY